LAGLADACARRNSFEFLALKPFGTKAAFVERCADRLIKVHASRVGAQLKLAVVLEASAHECLRVWTLHNLKRAEVWLLKPTPDGSSKVEEVRTRNEETKEGQLSSDACMCGHGNAASRQQVQPLWLSLRQKWWVDKEAGRRSDVHGARRAKLSFLKQSSIWLVS
jgi:hypothetical protein